MRALFAFMVFILMALPLAWFYVAMYWGFSVSQDIAAFQKGEEVTLTPAAPIRWLNDRAELREVYSPDEITRGRSVLTRIDLPFEDMLAPGEEMPPRELKDLYATMRAPSYLAPLCDEILGLLATSCDVGSFEGRVEHSGDGSGPFPKKERPEHGEAILSGTIRYTPIYPMGDPSIVPNGELIRARIELLDGERIENTPIGRKEVFAQALSLCGGLRVRFGNCVIGSVTIEPGSSQFNRDPDPFLEIEAAATFVVMVDKTQYRHASVRNELEAIAATRFAAIETIRRFLP